MHVINIFTPPPWVNWDYFTPVTFHSVEVNTDFQVSKEAPQALFREIFKAYDELLKLRNNSSDFEVDCLWPIWDQMEIFFNLLENPEFKTITSDNIEIVHLTITTLRDILLNPDRIPQGILDSFQMLVRCTALLTNTVPGNDHKLEHVLSMAISSHLDELCSGPASMDYMHHLNSAVEYYGRIKSLDYTNAQVNLPLWLGSIGESRLKSFLGTDFQFQFHDIQKLLSANHISECRHNPHARIDLDVGIECLSHSVELTPECDPYCPLVLSRLATSHYVRYYILHCPSIHIDDLDKAIQYQSRALDLTPRNRPEWNTHLALLSHYHISSVEQGLGEQKMRNMDRAVELLPQLLPHLKDSNQAFNAKSTSAEILKYQFLSHGNEKILDNAIEAAVSALSSIPAEYPDDIRAIYMSKVGILYRHRFENKGRLADIDMAIQYHNEALARIPGHGWLSRHFVLIDLSLSLRARYDRLGNPNDLLRMNHYFMETFNHPQGGGVSLEEMVELFDSMALIGSLHSRSPTIRNSIAIFPPDFLPATEQMIENVCEWLLQFHEGHSSTPAMLAFLSRLYANKFSATNDTLDLDKSIDSMTRAIEFGAEGHLKHPRWLHELAKLYHHRLKRSGSLEDFDRAREYANQALSLLSSGHIDIPEYLIMLGLLYTDRANIGASDGQFILQGLGYIRKAACCVTAYPSTRLRAASAWTFIAAKLKPDEALEGAQIAMSIIPEVVWVGNTINRRFDDMENIGLIVSGAAAVAISHGRCLMALEWLEQGRSIVWKQTLQLRTPIDDLGLADPHLTLRFKQISDELHYASMRSSGSEMTTNSQALESVEQKHRRLAEEYIQVLNEIRQRDDFKHFLHPKPARELLIATQTGPVVVVNVSIYRSDALILIPGTLEVTHIALPELSTTKVEQACAQLDQSLARHRVRDRGCHALRPKDEELQQDPFEDILGFLWSAIAKPVLHALGYIGKPIGELPRLTWCTTGSLAMLPLHAAGKYDRPQIKLSDFAISSYTPTLDALLSACATPSTAHTQLLVIGQAHTPGQSNLPGTEKELAHIESHVNGQTLLSRIDSIDATREFVLLAMEECDWVHFACHAHQNVANPMNSGFFLQDGILSLNDIIQRSFKDKGLAFLSACQTAKGDEKLADEAAHLASGMLLAGYRSVVASMWSIVDADAPVITDRVYGQLLKDGKMDHRGSAKALHAAVNKLREEVGDKAFTRWAPYIHIGV